jgi:hypothetical protein
LIMGTCVLAAVDKVIISNAAIYGMTADAHLVGNQYSWVGSIFYFGYLVAEYPAAFLIQRLPVAKFLSVCLLGWAIILMCTAATHDFAGLATVRFFMGMLESVVFPICSILTVMWWTTEEQPIRLAFWFNQVSTSLSLESCAHLTKTAFFCIFRTCQLRHRPYTHQSSPMATFVPCTRSFHRPLGCSHLCLPPRLAREMLVHDRSRKVRLPRESQGQQHGC